MNILLSWTKRSFFTKAVFLYLAILILLGIVNPKNLPDASIVLVQIVYAVLVLLFSNVYSGKSSSQTLVLILCFQLICGLGLRLFHILYFNNPFGYNPVDATAYNEMGEWSTLPFSQYVMRMYAFFPRTQIDDLGFPLILYVIYGIFGSYGVHVLVVINAIAITWSSYYLYKTALLFFDKEVGLFICFFWGIEAFAARTSACGLKENFFVFFMIGAMYYLCMIYKRKFSLKNNALFLLFTVITLSFRIVSFISLLATWIVMLFLKDRIVRKYMWFLALLLLSFILINLTQITDAIFEQRGISYETLEYAKESKGSTSIELVTNVIAALIGPFPSFLADEIKRNYITIYSFSSFAKMLFSLFYLYGIWYALINKAVEFLPFIILWALNTIMIVAMFFALHDRFQWPHIPYTLILSCLGYNAILKNRHKNFILNTYLLIVLSFILVFNFRL